MTTPPRRVLVVDDDPAQRELFRRTLVNAGYDVSLAPDGEQAILALQKSVPDALLLDLGLPGISGLEVVRRVRAMPAIAHLRILIVTGNVEQAAHQEAADLGCAVCLFKPFDPSSLPGLVAWLTAPTDSAAE